MPQSILYNQNNKYILFNIEHNIATITLNRVDVSNAFNPVFIKEILECLVSLSMRSDFQVLVIKANGKNFSAGADLNWMKSQINSSKSDNIKDAELLTKLMMTIYTFPKPTIAAVHGKTFGGGIGIIACCDISIARDDSSFCFSEAKLGLIPAVISPYIVKAIGQRQAQKLFLTAEVFDAQESQKIGLVHMLTNDLSSKINNVTKSILQCSPNALSNIKKLFLENNLTNIEPSLSTKLSQIIAELRVSKEGQQGIDAFLNKQTPIWRE